MKTVQRIQHATIKLILQHGYDKTAMEDIAQEAGVARSTIYTHWKTKEALFTALLQEEAIRLAHTWVALVEADPDGGTFTGIYRNGLLAIRDSAFARALYTQDRRVLGNFANQPRVAQLMTDRLDWLIRLLERMQAAALIRPDIDAKTLAVVAVTFRQGLLTINSDIIEPYGVSYEQSVDAFTAMFRQFIEPEPQTDASAHGKRILRELLEAFAAEYPHNTGS